MERERWEDVERLFERAAALPAGERRAFLEHETRDAELIVEVESLLNHDTDAFMAGGAAFRDAEPLPAGSSVGSYVIEGELGRGGMGVVYRAHDRRLGRPVAIKFILNPLLAGDADLERLEREARILAQFNHPNIATLYGLETTVDGRVFLVLELVEGASLAERLRSGALEFETARTSCLQVGRALATAHRRNVVHRDLKPENVLIDADGTVKVLDFGIARTVAPSMPSADAAELPPTGDRPAASHARGTPGYMSPEQLRGGEIDHRADIFAFGCLLYECLTGARAFAGATTRAIAEATFTRDPDFSKLPEATPAALHTLLRRCLEKDPDRRPARMEEAIEILAQRTSSESPATAALSEIPNNLPVVPSSFVGRRAELDTLRELAAGARLLTLVGPGGSGKTRLAIELARRLSPDFPAGVWFLDLAPVNQPNRVATVLRNALGENERPQQSPTETVLRALNDKRALLLFDNCEHLQSECAELIESLLSRCPRLAVMATSREALGLTSETSFGVPPLSVSDTAGESPEAVELFCQRARAARPGFRMNDANAADVRQICRRVEGMPLAIELVAARVRVMAPAEMARRLERSLDVFTRGSATAVTRHRTLRATFDWSYDLLGEEERILLQRLSVFAGGWDLDAAERVASDPDVLPEAGVLEVLTALVEKSLVTHSLTAWSEGRYRLLETNRQFAGERLQANGEEAAVRDRHLAYFVDFSRHAEAELEGAGQAEWLERVEAERENLEAALAWAAEHRQHTEAGLRLCISASLYWRLRADYRNGAAWIERFLSRADDTLNAEVKARALHAAGNIAARQEDHLLALRHIEASTAIMESLGLPTADHKRTLGMLATRAGDHERARLNYEASLAALGREHVRRNEQLVLIDLGNLATTMGDYQEALERFRSVDALLGDTQSAFELSRLAGNRAYVLNYMGDFEAALRSAEQALSIATDAGLREEIARAHINAGRALHYLGKLDEAESRLRLAVSETRDIGAPFYETFAILFLLPVLLDRAVPDGPAMEELFQRSAGLAHEVGLVHAEIASLSLGARISMARGDVAAALDRSRRAVEQLESLGHIEAAEEEILFTHARVLHAVGEKAESQRYLAAAYDELIRKADHFRDKELRNQFLAHPVSLALSEAKRSMAPGDLLK